MLSAFQSTLIKVVETGPGIGRGQVANIVGCDKSQTRWALRDLAQRGYLTEQVNGNGYAYFPAGQAAFVDQSVSVHSTNRPPRFPRSSGTALVVHNGAQPAQSQAKRPADNRFDVPAVYRKGAAIDPSKAAILNRLFVNDPEGADAIEAFHQEATNRLRAAAEDEQWQRDEYARTKASKVRLRRLCGIHRTRARLQRLCGTLLMRLRPRRKCGSNRLGARL